MTTTTIKYKQPNKTIIPDADSILEAASRGPQALYDYYVQVSPEYLDFSNGSHPGDRQFVIYFPTCNLKIIMDFRQDKLFPNTEINMMENYEITKIENIV